MRVCGWRGSERAAIHGNKIETIEPGDFDLLPSTCCVNHQIDETGNNVAS